MPRGEIKPYDRERAVAYARKWALSRNPAYLSYDRLGGDCTNFASQCIYAGSGVMDYTPTFGWYYLSGNQKAPAWTGVSYLYHFLLRPHNHGPVAVETDLPGIRPGDVVQLATINSHFHHTPVVTAINGTPSLDTIFVAAHSDDALDRPLSSYPIRHIRFLHITHVLS